MHLLMKMSQDTDDMERHRVVAEERGSVWWGNWTTSDRQVSPARVGRLRRQLDSGTPTFVWFRRGSPRRVWQCDLVDVTTDVRDVDDRLPDYYDGSGCNLFVLLDVIRQLPADDLTDRLALESRPDRSITQGALMNQTSPLYVVEFSAGL